MKKLKDLNVKGGDKNWTRAKFINALIAGELRITVEGSDNWHYHQRKRADKLESCGNWLKYIVDDKGNKRLHDARFCHDRLCQICGMRRYNHESARLYHVVNYLKDDYKFMIGTFTIKNVECNKADNGVNEINYAWSKMKNYKAIKPYLKGTVKKVETPVGKDGKCNAHIHVLMVVSPSFFHGKNSLNHSQWSKLWTRAVNKGYAPELHVERKGSYKQLIKSCNYLTKSYLCNDENYGWKLKDIKKVVLIDDRTRRKHLITYTGIMRTTDKIINARFKRANRINTGKHVMYGRDDNFNYDNCVETTSVYKKVNGHLGYYDKT